MTRRHRAEIPVRGYVFVVMTKRGPAPESYAVFDAGGRVGWVRLQGGRYQVRHRNARGRVLVEWMLIAGGDRFRDQFARRKWLAEAVRAFKREAERAEHGGGKWWGRLRSRGRIAES